jgi:hypothetical protein
MKRTISAAVLLCFVFISVFSLMSCGQGNGGEETIRRNIYEKAKPYEFNFVAWEVNAFTEFISNSIQERQTYSRDIELCEQITTILKNNGITVFPAVTVRLETPPYLLIISRRNQIVYYDRVLVNQTMTTVDMEKLESSIDNQDFISLVEPLGGFSGIYPPIVDGDEDLKFIVDSTVEEWLHQYLAFKPLGFLYLIDSLGLRQELYVITMNETLANMISGEIGNAVMQRYYPEALKPDYANLRSANKTPIFDFDSEMRITRKTVDNYLAAGNIEQAERYMEDRRRLFVANGYQIRKLNQAYFAFHGIYGSDPASISPVDEDLKLLRRQCGSIREFLEISQVMTRYQDLKNTLNK